MTQKCVFRILTRSLVLFWGDWYSKQSLIFLLPKPSKPVQRGHKPHSDISGLKVNSQPQTLDQSWFNRHDGVQTNMMQFYRKKPLCGPPSVT